MAFRWKSRDIDTSLIATTLGTLALAAAGGSLAYFLGLPLAWLLGAVIATGVWSACGWTIAGGAPHVPDIARGFAIPVLGVAIGSGFTPDIVRQMPTWWPTILGLLVYLPLVHWACYRIFRLSPQVSAPTAFYSAVPGGLVESVQMGEAAGGDVQMMTLLHLMRLIACVIFIPLGMGLVTGTSMSTAGLTAPDAPILLHHIPEILAVFGIGLLAGRFLRLPAGHFFGPLLVSAIAHGAGWSTFILPVFALIAAQVVLGAALGARFSGMPTSKLRLSTLMTLYSAVAIYGLAALAAYVLGMLSGISPFEIFLAYAPGGIVEMSLIAMSMGLNAIFVSCHHLMRIMFAVIGIRLFGTKEQTGTTAGSDREDL